MNQLKALPLSQLIFSIYPDMYAIHNLHDQVKLNMVKVYLTLQIKSNDIFKREQ